MATLAHQTFWADEVEPHCSYEEALHPCYSKTLKADLLPGTFVLLLAHGAKAEGKFQDMAVARIVKPVGSTQPFKVQVNIFKKICEIGLGEGSFLRPQGVIENYLRHLSEIVQTPELRVIDMKDIKNLAFVFTETSLHDPESLFFICQGMDIAFLLRFRVGPKIGRAHV